MITDSLFLKVFQEKKVDIPRPPVWFMRQAGRALSSYRKLKEKHTFIEMLRTPELAAEVTLLPRDALGIDALILFSDILVIPEALGVEVNYDQGAPKMLRPLKLSEGQLPENRNPDILQSVYVSIDEVKKRETEIPLIGFCGGPLTVFLYLHQGSGHGGNFDEALDFFYNHPQKVDKVLEEITALSIDYARGQIAHGVDAFQLFETWANIIPASVYQERILPYVVEMAKAIKVSVPLIFFPRFFSNGYELLSSYSEWFSGISIDYLMDMATLNQRLPEDMVLQGNIDPVFIKYAPPEKIRDYLNHYLTFFSQRRKWIVNLGHGVLPGTPESNLKLIVDTVKSFQA